MYILSLFLGYTILKHLKVEAQIGFRLEALNLILSFVEFKKPGSTWQKFVSGVAGECEVLFLSTIACNSGRFAA